MYRFMFIEGAILVFDCFRPPGLQKYFYERQEISNAVHYVPACVRVERSHITIVDVDCSVANSNHNHQHLLGISLSY